jgi:hypothetical protein
MSFRHCCCGRVFVILHCQHQSCLGGPTIRSTFVPCTREAFSGFVPRSAKRQHEATTRLTCSPRSKDAHSGLPLVNEIPTVITWSKLGVSPLSQQILRGCQFQDPWRQRAAALRPDDRRSSFARLGNDARSSRQSALLPVLLPYPCFSPIASEAASRKPSSCLHMPLRAHPSGQGRPACTLTRQACCAGRAL